MQMSILGTTLLSFFALSLSRAAADSNDDRSCNFFGEEPGWKCSSGECIPLGWVCDSNPQCPHPDMSDETDGCNLFPETGCNSWHGRRYTKCPFSPHRCVENVDTECPKEDDQLTSDLTSTSCPASPLTGADQWRCNDGLCIEYSNVCDSHKNCHDGSDELEGCNLFPETNCRSWFGKRHIVCSVNGTSICTLPEFEFMLMCRSCDVPGQWRCDNGWCIAGEKLLDGIPDCPDGSDEHTIKVKWWFILLITMIVATIGILISFIYRHVSKQTHSLFCEECRAAALILEQQLEPVELAKKSVKDGEEKQVENGGQQLTDSVDTVADKCLVENGYVDWDDSDEAVLPLKLIKLLEKKDFWRKRSFVGVNERTAQVLYAKIHQDPVLYRNLYHYIVYRYSTSEDLARLIDLLRRWEMEFHNEVAIEVLKCWRLQLGMCDILKHVIRSIQPPSALDRFYEKICFPTRNWFRRERKQLPENVQTVTEKAYTFFKTCRYSLIPFLGASALYFDICKDIAIAFMISTSLADLSKNNYFGNKELVFETSLLFVFVLAIVLVQIGFMLISAYYATDIFEICSHTKKHRKMFFRFFIFLLGPLMPAFILANHVYYSEQEHSLRRDLETCEFAGKESEIRSTCKTTLFKKIQHVRFRSQLHRRIYSFYRVTEAVIESTTLIVVLVLIYIVTPRPNRAINLLNGVQSKIGYFLGLCTSESSGHQDETFLNQLGIASDVVFIVSILYSFIMILTALVRYVYQCKGKNVLLAGQLFLGLYFACHAITRLTVTIAMFSTAEEAGVPDGALTDLTLTIISDYRGPVITIFPVSIVALFLFVLHFVLIYVYKYVRIEEFAQTNPVEQFVHVLCNTFVVVPFMTWDIADDRTSLNEAGDFFINSKSEECVCLKRSVSYDEIAKKNELKTLVATAFKSHRRSASDTTGMQHVKEVVCTSNSRSGSRHQLDMSFSTANSRSASHGKLNAIIVDETKDSKPLFPHDGKMMSMIKKFKKQRKLASKKEPPLEMTQQNFFPNFEDAFDYLKVRQKIQKLWWDDPGRDLSEEETLEKFGKLTSPARVKRTYNDLVKKGFINRKLFNPRRTKTEFFWLLILHLVINLVALGIEVVNGGIQTNKGLYYSWDIRLSTFFLGLIFLALYYKKYHLLHELTHFQLCGFCWNYLPVFCCLKKDKAMTAIPEELDNFLSSAEQAVTTHEKTESSRLPSFLEPPKCIETQTSCIEVYVKTDQGFQEVSTGKKFSSDSEGLNDFSSQTELKVPSAPPLMTSQTQTSLVEVHNRNGHEHSNSKDSGDRDVTKSLLENSGPEESGAEKSSPKNMIVSVL